MEKMLYIITGLSGCGKTTYAKQFSGNNFIETSSIVADIIGSENKKDQRDKALNITAIDISRRLLEVIIKDSNCKTVSGCRQLEIINILETYGYSVCVYWLELPIKTLVKRLQSRDNVSYEYINILHEREINSFNMYSIRSRLGTKIIYRN
jgi:predicted kinase